MNAYVETIWTRTRQARIGFFVGLLIGALLGWFFHGLISFIVRFFFVLVLLVPLALALYAWFRFRRELNRVRSRPADDDWPPPVRRTYRDRSSAPVEDGGSITVDGWETWDAPAPRRAPEPGVRREP